ncbi:ATP-binding protein [Helicovermis profundi]|uniref:ATP-binding protein n=1 Tax=Helicovermis profundi TaxID=3065157 RepID=A0AAU9EAX7_9FIRM|nr:ATP-binding protein [Clostridia bacterium S502]
MKDSILISLPLKSEYISVARLTASIIANKVGFDIEEIEDIKVAIGEACNNAVLHANKEGEFNIKFEVSENTFEAEIIDNGRGFEYNNYKTPDLENPKDHGLGIFIMKSLMDNVEVNSIKNIGTSIKLTKTLIGVQ